MKELRNKLFLTIFSILSLVVIVTLVLGNVQNYNREKEGIVRNLAIFDDGGVRDDPSRPRVMFEPDFAPDDKPEDAGTGLGDPGKFDPEQMMIMDHEVYTAELSDGKAVRIISHGNSSDDFDIEGIVANILADSQPGSERIGNLFIADYSYSYRHDDRLVIVNDSLVAENLRRYLLFSVLVFVIMEGIFAIASKRMTERIVRPAQEAFTKQKEFIADASHELKTPLAVIMASADELGDPEFLTKEKASKLTENIRYESERMSRLIAQLLDMSRIEESVEETYAVEDLSRLVEKTALAYEAVAFECGVSIETDIAANISFICNRDEMEKMVSTILDNAVHHSYKDSSVLVELKESKGCIEIRIVNKGDPIPEGDEERIFERFYRGDASRNRADNRYGLGLAIARSIARKHRGDIKASSSGGCTQFLISLKNK